jgi:restriction endonuclease/XPA-like protein
MPRRIAKPKPKCIDCGKVTYRVHPILDISLCADCRKRNEKYAYITKTRALQEYRLKPDELSRLRMHEVDNPYYKKAAPMQLYLHSQVREMSKVKWGGSEPYIVTLVEFSEEFLAWLLEDLERLKQLPPDKFQNLVADRLEHMGLEVQLVGDVFRKDGGVDIIAYPNASRCAVPFLFGVQVKHHRTTRKTGSPDVRDLYGTITSRNSPFHMGMIVTNTSFTAGAQWFASHNQVLLRLRDLRDLRRWLQNDFVNEEAWREIPNEVELAPGIRIQIPKPKIVIPGL